MNQTQRTELLTLLARESYFERSATLTLASAHNHGAHLRGFFVRKETKPHGLQQQIEGAFRRELRAAVIDDTITTGGSSLQAAAALTDAGATVTHAFAL